MPERAPSGHRNNDQKEKGRHCLRQRPQHWAWWQSPWPATMLLHGGHSGMSVMWLHSPSQWRPKAAWEVPPRGRRLLQDLPRELDKILYLSGCRQSHARRGIWGSRRAAGVPPWPPTNNACNKSWAWPGWRATSSVGVVAWKSWGWSPPVATVPGRRQAMKARMRTRTTQQACRGTGGHSPSDCAWPFAMWRRSGSRFWPVSTCEHRPKPRCSRSCERALALVRQLTDSRYVSWRPNTLKLIVNGFEIRGSNLLDLVGHVVCQCWPQPLKHGSPGPHPSFAKLAPTLRHANASWELLRHWSEI